MICFDHNGRETRIVHTTLHVSLRRVIELVTRERYCMRYVRATLRSSASALVVACHA